MVTDFTDALLGYGFSAQQVATTYRELSMFLLGHLILETGDLTTAEVKPLRVHDTPDPTAELADRLLDLGCPISDFTSGVESLINSTGAPVRRS